MKKKRKRKTERAAKFLSHMGKGEGILDGFNFLSYLQNFLVKGHFTSIITGAIFCSGFFPLVVLFLFKRQFLYGFVKKDVPCLLVQVPPVGNRSVLQFLPLPVRPRSRWMKLVRAVLQARRTPVAVERQPGPGWCAP